MVDAVEWRKRLGAVVQRNFLVYRQGDVAEIDFTGDFDTVFSSCPDAVWREDPSFLAAWSFADDFFDAAAHGFAWGVPDRASGRELSVQESEEIMEHIIERLTQGADITHPVVLSHSDRMRRTVPSEDLPGCAKSLVAVVRRLLRKQE